MSMVVAVCVVMATSVAPVTSVTLMVSIAVMAGVTTGGVLARSVAMRCNVRTSGHSRRLPESHRPAGAATCMGGLSSGSFQGTLQSQPLAKRARGGRRPVLLRKVRRWAEVHGQRRRVDESQVGQRRHHLRPQRVNLVPDAL